MQADRNNSLRIDMSPHLDTLFWFRAKPSFLLLLNAACGEATNTNFIVFGLTRSGLERTSYCTWGEHANHYTTDAVQIWLYLHVHIYNPWHLQLQKENTEGYIEYLKSIDWLDEAAKRLVNIIDDDGYVSKEGKSKHQVREIISSNTLIYFKFGLL